MPQYYTPKEATEALDVIRPMIEDMMQIGEKIRVYQPELWALVENPHGKAATPR